MFASTDPPYLFDGSLQGHLEESLPLPQSRPYPSTLFPFPPPSFDHDSTSDRALDDHLLGIPMAPAPPPFPNQPKETSANRDMAATPAPRGLHGIKKNSVGVPQRMIGAGRRRTPRKDRHSKINTAQGPRDRRMRLSLDVARRFFDLQDILGFDKASRTVEWLLVKSRSAIKDLTGCSPSPLPHSDGVDAKVESTSTSECEVISVSTTDNPTAGETTNAAQEVDTLPSRAKKAVARPPPPRKAPANPALARQTRLMARARARERTREKMWCRELHDGGQAVQLLSWSSPLQMEGVKPRVHGMNSFLEMVALGEQAISYLPEPYRTTVQESSEASTQAPVITGAPGQISVFDYMGINVAHDGGGTTFFAQEQGNTQNVR